MAGPNEATLRIKIDAEQLQEQITEAFRPIREAVEALRENVLAMGSALDEIRKAIDKWEIDI